MNMEQYKQLSIILTTLQALKEAAKDGSEESKEALQVFNNHGLFAYKALLQIRKAKASLAYYESNAKEVEKKIQQGGTMAKYYQDELKSANELIKKGKIQLRHAEEELALAKEMWSSVK